MAAQNPACCFFGPVPGEEPTPSCPALQAEEPGKGVVSTRCHGAWLCLPAANHCLSPVQFETLNKETVALGGLAQDFAASALLISGPGAAHGLVSCADEVWGSSPDLH